MSHKGASVTQFKERIAYATCPLCNASDIEELRTDDCSRHPSWKPPLSPSITWMRCGSCGHGFTNGYFTDEALGLVFEHIQTNQRPGDNVHGNRGLSAAIVERVLPFKASGTWLDVGYGNGSLMFTAQEFGFDVVGLDLRKQAVEDMEALGFEAHCADICDWQAGRSADVISMADVLEHTPFPKDVLRAAHGNLDADGVLFLSMPNADAFLWHDMTAKKINPYWGEIEHYHNFGRKRLYDLLEETGFEPLRYGISARYKCGMEVVAKKV